MAGEGENEKQEAICAAAKLGISGLVEVTSRLSAGTKQHAEAGVQTEPLRMEGGRLVKWRREVRDGFTYLWKDTLSESGRDVWTQTEEELVNSLPPHPAVPYETINMDVLQSLGQTVTLVYPPAENQMLQSSSASTDCLQEASGSSYVAMVTPQYMPPPDLPPETPSHEATSQSCQAEPNPNELEQFEASIAGFIDSFLNLEKKENTCRGRGGGRPRGDRKGQQRTRTPTGRTARRPRGGLTQKVDTQEIGVSKLQKLFPHRWVVSKPRTGQGGGTVGRKLCQKTREELESISKGRRRRGRKTVFEVGQSPYLHQGGVGGTAKPQRGRRHTPQKLSAASPPPAPRPQEDKPEEIESLLEEVMMGLDILPNRATHSRHPLSRSGHTFSSSEVPVLQQQSEGELHDELENFLHCFDIHTESGSPRKEKETGDETSSRGKHSRVTIPHTPHRLLQASCSQTPRVQGADPEPSSLNDAIFPSEETKEKTVKRKRRPNRRKCNTYLFSLEKRSMKRKTAPQELKAGKAQGQRDQQLQQTPVVKLERSRLMAVGAMLQGDSSQSASQKRPSEAKTISEKNSSINHIGKNPVIKSYITRSKCREAKIQDFKPLLQHNPAWNVDQQRGGRPKINGSLPASSHVDRTSVVQPQSPGSCCTDEQKNQRRHGEVLIGEEEAQERGTKREAEPMKEIDDEVRVDKRVCADLAITRETSMLSPPSALAPLDQDEIIDVETLSLSSFPDCFQEPTQKEEPPFQDKEILSGQDSESSDSIIDVEGDQGGTAEDWLEQQRCSVSPKHPNKQLSLGWMGKWEEDGEDQFIDVIGSRSKASDPGRVTWMKSSGDDREGRGQEEVDVLVEKMDGIPPSSVNLSAVHHTKISQSKMLSH
ncbi:PREDICTED: uncharacterized protein LOC107101014 [Cyprinodon variegatus]|uniref:uncharacterized protein LOC107101014 n=1 Tax=Cyprinodon variegatus TaxID=28743 RepID=UPI0007427A5A|nr:PREDICTED: uncharacterized protein LOC107101014 [Cyprinodon variegatus]